MQERSVNDMPALIRVEKLKMRHSFGRFLPVSAVGVQVLISLCLSWGSSYYSVNAWNWWYTMILPRMLAILCYLGMKKEKKQHYANLLTTHIPPDKCWIGKILYFASRLLCANLLICMAAYAGGIFTGSTIPPMNGLAAAVLLSICHLWEIPLYMMLSVRFGMFADILTCMTLTIGSLIALAPTKLWWLCPASIPIRLMCPVLQIMPNGLIVEPGSHYMSTAGIIPGVTISFIWFVILTYVTAHGFSKKEYT